MNPKQLVPNLKVIIFELVAGMLNFLFACLASVSLTCSIHKTCFMHRWRVIEAEFEVL